MKLFSELKRATEILLEYPSQWAICGGVAASIYREKARFTDDIDFRLLIHREYQPSSLPPKLSGSLATRSTKALFQARGDTQAKIFAPLCARRAFRAVSGNKSVWETLTIPDSSFIRSGERL